MLNRFFKGHDILYVFCEQEFVVSHDNIHLNGLSNMTYCLQTDPGETILYKASSKQVVLVLYRALVLNNNIIIQ